MASDDLALIAAGAPTVAGGVGEGVWLVHGRLVAVRKHAKLLERPVERASGRHRAADRLPATSQ
ncbi:MAG: hypothetical protein ACLP0J_01325 [Solirubrobacteraceae bacterium]|jgi:hypothetical protein